MAEAKRVLADPADPLHSEEHGMALQEVFDLLCDSVMLAAIGGALVFPEPRDQPLRAGVWRQGAVGARAPNIVISAMTKVETGANGKKTFEGSSADEANGAAPLASWLIRFLSVNKPGFRLSLRAHLPEIKIVKCLTPDKVWTRDLSNRV